MIANPAVAKMTEREILDVQKAAAMLGRTLTLLNASNAAEIEAAFGTILEKRIQGLLVQVEPFLTNQREQLVLLTTRHALATISGIREFPLSGGLMSYGPSLPAAWLQAGGYAARILRGEKPTDLPVVQPTKFEFVINLRAAKALGLEVPPTLLAIADEVIE
jgi:putative ABC transport system substrate-binding protein